MTDEQAHMLSDLHTALMKSPPKSNKPPLIEDIREMTSVYKGGKWGLRALLWVIPTSAALVVALRTLKDAI